MLALRIAAVIAAMALTGQALAGDASTRKTYKCKNEKGETYYSDHFVPDQCKGGGSQLNSEGVSVKTIERQMSPEEAAALKEKAAQDAEAARIVEKQTQSDRVLMQSYANEEELTRAHQKELTQIDSEITAARVSLDAQEKNLTELLNMAADAERASQKVSPAVSKNIGIVRRQVESQKVFIQRKQQQKEDLDRVYEARLARYRELASQQKAKRDAAAAQPH